MREAVTVYTTERSSERFSHFADATYSQFCALEEMQRIHLVRVMTDSGERQIWLAATGRDEAVDQVLDFVPEGWSASLIQRELDPDDAAALNLNPGEVRQHRVS
jgi:hypothetical protein